jgi:hypothetical protein
MKKLTEQKRQALITQFKQQNSGKTAYQVKTDAEGMFDAYFELHHNDPVAIKKILIGYKEFRDQQIENLTSEVITLIGKIIKTDHLLLKHRKGGKKISIENRSSDIKVIDTFIKSLQSREKKSWNTFKRKFGIKKPPFEKTKFYELLKLIEKN